MDLEQARKEADAVMAKAAAEAAAQQARRARHAWVWERLRTAVIALSASYFATGFAASYLGEGIHPLLVGLPVGLLAAVLLPPRRARSPG